LHQETTPNRRNSRPLSLLFLAHSGISVFYMVDDSTLQGTVSSPASPFFAGEVSLDNGSGPPAGALSRITFGHLDPVPGLVHGFFTRHGGVSAPPYSSLNAAWTIGDAHEAVATNLDLIRRALGVSRLVASPQVHGDAIHVIDEEALARCEECSPLFITPPGDALITSLPDVGIVIKVADCQPIFLVDPVRHVVANIHCGWRGSVARFPLKVVQFLTDRFGCRPQNLLAAVGPSLGPCCAEFIHYREELPQAFWQFETGPKHFDFWAITRRQLTAAGLRPEKIAVAGRCTKCETDTFFSYRGEKNTGRLAAVIAWQEAAH